MNGKWNNLPSLQAMEWNNGTTQHIIPCSDYWNELKMEQAHSFLSLSLRMDWNSVTSHSFLSWNELKMEQIQKLLFFLLIFKCSRFSLHGAASQIFPRLFLAPIWCLIHSRRSFNARFVRKLFWLQDFDEEKRTERKCVESQIWQQRRTFDACDDFYGCFSTLRTLNMELMT